MPPSTETALPPEPPITEKPEYKTEAAKTIGTTPHEPEPRPELNKALFQEATDKYISPPAEKNLSAFSDDVSSFLQESQEKNDKASLTMREKARQEPPTVKPDLGSILADARSAGQDEMLAGAYNARKEFLRMRESLGERVKQARERASRAWDGVRNFGDRWKTATSEFAKVVGEKMTVGVETTREGAMAAANAAREGAAAVVQTGVGLALNSEVRNSLGAYMRERLNNSVDALVTKQSEIREAANDKKDQAFLRLQEGARGLWKRAQEVLIQPQVNRAKELAGEVRTIWGAGTAAGERVVGFFQNQAENTSREVRSRGHEVLGWWHDALAKPGEIQHQVAAGLAERISTFASARLEKTQDHRAKAADLRLQAKFVKAGIGGPETTTSRQ